MSNEDEFNTTVLSNDYSDYRDTVVDQADGFDPSLFSADQGAPAGGTTRPMWKSADAQLAGEPKPAWASAGEVNVISPPEHDPDEETWVLDPSFIERANSGEGQAGVPPAQRTAGQSAGIGGTAVGHATSQQPTSSAWQNAPQTTSAMMAATDVEPYRMSPALIGALVGLIAVGLICVVVVAVLLLSPPQQKDVGGMPESASATMYAPVSPAGSSSSAVDPGDEEQPAEEASSERSAEASGRESSSPAIVNGGDGRAVSEAEFYSALLDYYDLAGDYNDDLRGVAEAFNSTFLKEDRSAREAKAKAASTLKSKIKSSWDDLRQLDPPMMSKNTQAYRDLCELYECLWHRIDVIDQAWKVDLQYDKPQEHESDIVAPLRAQQENGTDRYYARFKELYPRVSLVKP